MARPRYRQGRRQGARQTTKATQLPASFKGINATGALASMQPDECIYAYNILALDFGTTVRQGFSEWANGWTGGPAKTIIAFEGNVGADDKMFVANATGIWDVTIEGTTSPTQVVAFPSSAGDAGICSTENFSNDGDARFLLVCDEENGYYTWTQATNTWAKITQGSGAGQIKNVDPATFAYVVTWKKRIWFIEKGTGKGWYLAAGTFTGHATAFNFADNFRTGGELSMIVNWTLDGGAGLDDYLVALSGSGDVLIFQGTDPASASTFAMVGAWDIGKPPAGRRFAAEYAGEVYILSMYGLMPLTQLVNGAKTANPDIYTTRKIAPYIQDILSTTIDSFGWHIHMHPKQSRLFINSPPRISLEQIAFSMYVGHDSWSMIRGLPKAYTINWQGEVYWIDIERNKIFKQTGAVDGVYIDPATDGDPEAIEWDVLTAFSTLGEPSIFKRCQYIRPTFLSGGEVGFTVAARYDYDISEISGSPIFTSGVSGLWDVGAWDAALWGGGVFSSDVVRGANGIGRAVAINLKGRSSEETTLISYDISWDSGGIM